MIIPMFGVLQQVGEAKLWLMSGPAFYLTQIMYNLTKGHPNLWSAAGGGRSQAVAHVQPGHLAQFFFFMKYHSSEYKAKIDTLSGS
jgi:hypothetical protein